MCVSELSAWTYRTPAHLLQAEMNPSDSFPPSQCLFSSGVWAAQPVQNKILIDDEILMQLSQTTSITVRLFNERLSGFGR